MAAGDRVTDIVVVGGGAIGAAAALELTRRGAAVMLVERGDRLASGCSYGSAGVICPSHASPLATPANLRAGLRWMWKRDSPFSLRPRPGAVPWLVRFAMAATPRRAQAGTRIMRSLAAASLELHAQYAASGLQTGFTRGGVLYTFETASRFDAARHEVAQDRSSGDRGTPRIVDLDEARRLVPGLTGAIAGAVFAEHEAHCDSRGFVDAVGEAARAEGAVIRTGVEVVRLRRQGRRVVGIETAQGGVSCGTVVLAAGVWTRRLAGRLGIPLALEGGKGYHVDLEPGKGDPEVPVYMQEARVIATPLRGRLRLAGTLELAGLDASVDQTRIEALRAAAARSLTGLAQRPPAEVWAGLRPCSADGLPIIGRARNLDNVVMATGHGMSGLALAPITGRLVAQLLTGEEPALDVRPFSPDRFRVLPCLVGRREP